MTNHNAQCMHLWLSAEFQRDSRQKKDRDVSGNVDERAAAPSNVEQTLRESLGSEKQVKELEQDNVEEDEADGNSPQVFALVPVRIL